MTQITDTSTTALLACEEGFDPIEDRLRTNIRGTIEAVFDEELNGFLCSASTSLSGVLPHPRMFPSGISIASPDMFLDASNYPSIAAGGGVPLTRGVPT